ncbi:helix-turn-helix domain-containing protein [Streptomyces sp. JB150]|uniref:helix-turn-helix domain-containing protein n=1 Tax=Streptomyces sp. JB150 TaxID=2714844 RepID=UPI0014097369|nr:helix-turn-helix domain-containing protein [Streptomyces sp. JB150]QIJ63249.1 helix-turn-helix transcriptional regulator [Streptomyces sp. JB150]
MGWWQLDADTLARSRFLLSPYAETFASLKLLHAGTGAHPGEREWLRAHLPAYRARLAADPVTARLVRAGLGRDWIADFLTPTPREGEDFARAVARVRATRPDAARAHLRLSLAGPLPAVLDRDDLPERAAALLTYVWTEAVRPYWARRRRVLEADVVARTARMSEGGWAAVLDALRPGTRWLGASRFQVNLHEYPPRDISGAELVLVPVTPRTGWVSWEEPERQRYALVYPCSGPLADGHARPAPASLAALLGRARAAVLVLLDSPLSTTQLTAVTGQGLGSVGRHLRVLRDAGLVERRRAGRSVLYARTAAGDVLIRAAAGDVPVRAASGAAPTRSAAGDERIRAAASEVLHQAVGDRPAGAGGAGRG